MNCTIGNIVPWYELMWKEMCPHENIAIVTIQAITTCETIQYYCVDCDRTVGEITDCV